MKPSHPIPRFAALAACALIAAAGPAAARSSHKAPAQPAQAEQPAPEPAGVTGYGIKLGGFFSEQQKKAARNYFTQRYGRGKDCPPGMERSASKKCAPPVEGRYWAVGQALQPAVTVHPLPEPALSKLPPPPSGYEYLMAGDDILLVSKGLHLVVDMIENVMG